MHRYNNRLQRSFERLLSLSLYFRCGHERSQPTKPSLNGSNLSGPASGYAVVSRPLMAWIIHLPFSGERSPLAVCDGVG